MPTLGMRKIVAFYLLMAGISVLLLAWHGRMTLLLPDLTWSLVLTRLCAGVGVGLVFVVGSRFFVQRYAWARRLKNDFSVAVGGLTSTHALILACLSAVGEEALFRGVVQLNVGIWLASVLFAALHVGSSSRFFAWTLMAFLGGLAFGTLLLQTGDLIAPIVAHGTVNFLNLRYLSSGERTVELKLEGCEPL